MPNVLLVNSNCRTGARLLQDRPDVRLSVITIDKYRHFYDPGTDVELVDSVADLTGVRLAALRIRERHPFDWVVAPSEWSVQAGGYLRSYLGLPGPGYEVANAFSNKFVMKQKLAAAGLPVTAFRRMESLDDTVEAARHLGWPVVVKRACGGGAGYVVVIRDPDHLHDVFADDSRAAMRTAPFPLLAEQMVDIEAEYHCDGVVIDGHVRFAPVSRYFAPVLDSVGGVIGSYTLPDHDPETHLIADLHTQVVDALGLRDGVTHLEVFKSPDGYLIGEIACRPGGGGITAQIRHQYGIDLWDTFLDLATGAGVDIAPAPRDDHMIQYMLPRPAGTVTAITSREELLRLDCVVDATITTRVGDNVSGPLDSSVYAGVVIMRAATRGDITRNVAAIDAAFQIAVADGRTTVPSGGKA
ncbi:MULTISPECIES: ATP-grasp domain-containing protein [Micromonospora]|uniref:ATP-grasp domain-containing protein n=1 Tax=Micromonospora zamorensis TaxID=709883 RepID=A0ABZ1PMK2_9ACTN|nr:MULTISPECIES: ATP-grasp domain-containing protein [Micromonospora]